MPKPSNNPLGLLGTAGQNRFVGLLRRGQQVHREMTSIPGTLSTIDILRYSKTAPGTPHRGIAPTTALVAGLTGIAASIELPNSFQGKTQVWDGHAADNTTALKENERYVWLRDVPATVSERQDVVLLTDVLLFDDPIYGPGKKWRVMQVRPHDAARLIRVRVELSKGAN